MTQINPLVQTLSCGVGAEVEIVLPLVSDDAARVHVEKGDIGRVLDVDEQGDALISLSNGSVGARYDGIWIYRHNHWKLKVRKAGPLIGSDVMVLQPFESRDDVHLRLEKGDRGTVIQIDESGDACIHFPTRRKGRFDKFWVSVFDFENLKCDEAIQHGAVDETADSLVAALASMEELIRISMADQAPMWVGASIQPIVPLVSDDDARVHVEQGRFGKVVRIDADGDACIHFPAYCSGTDGLWVFQQNLWKLKITTGEFYEGLCVEVVKPFTTDDDVQVALLVGDSGTVVQIDDVGDACVEFPTRCTEHGIDQFWVWKRDFCKLRMEQDAGGSSADAMAVSKLRRSLSNSRAGSQCSSRVATRRIRSSSSTVAVFDLTPRMSSDDYVDTNGTGPIFDRDARLKAASDEIKELRSEVERLRGLQAKMTASAGGRDADTNRRRSRTLSPDLIRSSLLVDLTDGVRSSGHLKKFTRAKLLEPSKMMDLTSSASASSFSARRPRELSGIASDSSDSSLDDRMKDFQALDKEGV